MAFFVFEGMAEAFVFSISAAEILANQFSAILFGKAIVTTQSRLSSNYCVRVTAEGASQNAVRLFFNTEFILKKFSPSWELPIVKSILCVRVTDHCICSLGFHNSLRTQVPSSVNGTKFCPTLRWLH